MDAATASRELEKIRANNKELKKQLDDTQKTPEEVTRIRK